MTYSHSKRRSKLSNLRIISIILLANGLALGGISSREWIQRSLASHGCGDAVAITVNTSWTVNECHGDVTITNGATLTISGNTSHTLSSLTLGDGVTNGFITAQGHTASGNGVTLTVDGNVEVKASSSISANGQGFGAGAGPGAGGASSGGSYGGMGGGSNSPDTYGSATNPVNLGSGGSAHPGGGAIIFSIGGNLVQNGTISANGNGATTGGGSGGTINITFTGGSSTWSGNGSITANGGEGAGGGRIAVTGIVTNSHSGTRSAFTGNAPYGASGTIFLKTTAQTNGTLIIDSNSLTPVANKFAKTNVTTLTLDDLQIKNQGRFLVPSGATLTLASDSLTGTSNGVLQNEGTLSLPAALTLPQTLIQRGTLNQSGTDLTISSGGILTVDTTTTFGNVTVQASGNINHTTNTTAETYKIDLTVTDLNVNASGTINVNSLGYNASNGPGAGGTSSGGGYGGMGNGVNGDTYGSATVPVNIGSGGSAHKGGGSIKITINDDLVNAGTISANGAGTSTGGGSGGSVYLIFTGAASDWSGAGTITATGGEGAGGGRIAIVDYDTDSHGGATTAYTGNPNYGASGTVFLKSSAQTNGTLIIDSNNLTPVTDKFAKAGVSPLTLDELQVKNQGRFLIPNSTSLTIATSGTMTGTSTGITRNEGTFTVAATTTLSHTFQNRGAYSAKYALDGINDYLSATAGSFSTNGTIEGYITPTNVNGTKQFLISRYSGTNGYQVYIDTDNRVKFWVNNTVIAGSTALSNNTTYHIAAVASGTTARIFIDGVQDATGTVPNVTASGTFYIGADNGTSSFFTGKYSQLRISSTARYSGTFTPPTSYTNDGSTVNIWALTEGDGAIVDSGSSNVTMNIFNIAPNETTSGWVDHSITPAGFDGGTSLTIASGGTLAVDSAITDTNLAITVQSGGNLTHTTNSTGSKFKMNLTIADLTVNASATVNANALGYDTGAGPGYSTVGGGYGGMGGQNGTVGGDTYGSAIAPVHLGSGGSSSCTGGNHRGGGAIKITLTGTLTNNGTISANGEAVCYGASGGSVWINFTGVSGTWAGNGAITANAPNSLGGGGRVAITGYTTDTHSGNPTAYGTSSGGAAGTVFMKSAAQTGGTLRIDNNSVAPATSRYAYSGVTNLTLDSLVVQNQGKFMIPTGSTVTIASGGSLAGNSTGTTQNNGTLTVTDTATLSHVFQNRGVYTSKFALDGINDSLTSSDNSLNISGNITAEGYFTPTNLGTKQYLFSQYSGSNGYQLYIDTDNRVKFWAQNTLVSGTTALSNNTSYHIAGVVSGTTARIFIDGVQDGTGTVSATITVGTFYIGRDTGAVANFFAGKVHQVRISNSARYSGTFTPPTSYTHDTNSIAIWSFNDGDGQPADSTAGEIVGSLTPGNVVPNETTSGWVDHLITPAGFDGGTALTIASGGTLAVDSAISDTNLAITVQSGGNLTHSANSTGAKYKMNLTIADLTVNASGTVNANELGYDRGQGPGYSSRGGGYGGMGGDNLNGGGGDTYGSAIAPVNIGSGGESCGSNQDGGGAIKITLTGTLTNNGTISANGSASCYGGSGGSVWLNFTGGSGTWAGNGAITANASATLGGGGRVAITGYTTDTHSGNPTAYGTSSGGAAGTVYTKSAAQTYGTMRIDNNSVTPATTRFAHSGVTNLTLDSLVVQNQGKYMIPTGSTLTIASGGTLAGNSTGTTQNNGTFVVADTTTLSHTFQNRGVYTSKYALDGINDSLTTSDNSINFSGDRTMEGYFTPTNLGTKQYLLSQYAGSTGYQLYIDTDNRIKFWVHNTVVSGTTALSNNTSYHIATTTSGTTARIFINGVEDGTGTVSVLNPISTFYIGRDTGAAANFFAGKVHQIRISNSVRYTGTFTPPTSYTHDTNSIAIWSFNDADGQPTDSTLGEITGSLTPGNVVPNETTSGWVDHLITPAGFDGGTALTIASGGTLTVDSAITDSNLAITVQSGGNINHTANTTGTKYKVNLTLANLTINAGATVNVNALGYDVSQGPGTGDRGAGYGGIGGDNITSSIGGDTYGSATQPTHIGSGGGGGCSNQKGGGAIKITLTGTLSNSGTISANSGNNCYSGSGGSVWINFTGGSGTWAGNGAINADALASYGGGGRVAVTGYTTDTHSGAVTAYGNGSNGGSAGTVYTKSTAQTYGTLKIDNNSAASGSTRFARSGITNLTLDSLQVQNQGKFHIPVGSTLTIAPSGTLAGNSTGTTRNDGTFTATDPITLSHTFQNRGVYTSKYALDGVNDYLSTSDASINFSGDRTMEGYFTPSNINGTKQYLFSQYSGTNGYQVYIDTDNRIKFWGQNTVVSGSTTLSNDTTYHIATTTSGTTARIFINGVEDGTGTVSTLSPVGTFYIGRDTGAAANFFAGKLSQLRISNTARYSGTFTPPTSYTHDTNSIAIWSFNDGDGQPTDSTSGEITGSLSPYSVVANESTSGWVDHLITPANFDGGTALTIASGGALAVDSAITDTNLSITVQSGGNVTHSDNSTGTKYKMNLTIANLTVDSGGTVNVNGLGYDLQNGPGGGTSSGWGGSYGGMASGTTAGDTYGSAIAPTHIGSGGYAASGGGAIKITLTGTLSNAGTISANGAGGGSGYETGSGGSVWINYTGGSGTWSGNGTITANSDGTTSNSSYGAGGRVAITGYTTDTHGGTTSARGGKASTGAAGTVFTKSAAQTNGTLTIDNGSFATATANRYTKTGVTNLTLDSLVVQNLGNFQIPTGSTVTIASGGSLGGNSTGTTQNNGSFVVTDTATLSHTFQNRGVYTSKFALDGVNDYFTSGSSFLNIATNMTVEGSFTPTNINGTKQYLFSKYLGSNGYQLYIDTDNKLKFWVQNSALVVGATTLSSNTTYHIAAVASGTTAKIYVNGVEDGTGTVSSLTSAGTFYIGQSGGAQNYFAGKIHQIRISNSARYSGTFTPPTSYSPDANGMAIWSFNDGTGFAADSSLGELSGNLGPTNVIANETTSGWVDHLITPASFDGGTSLTIASGGTLAVDSAISDPNLSLTVQSGGNLTHTDNSTGSRYRMNLTLANLTVDSGGTVNVNGLGYDSLNGPGAGTSTGWGGSYGGMGSGTNAGDTYGSATQPTHLGSGGSIASGGGAIKITLTGTLSNAGTISANGAGGSSNYETGSGGSVWINFTGGSGTWAGNGTITANSDATTSNSSYGAGGRVAVTGFTTDTHGGATSARTGKTGGGGAAGTVFIKSAAQTNGTLTIENNNFTTQTAGKYTKTGVTNLTVDSLVVNNLGNFQIPSGSTLTIASSGSLTHAASSTIVNGGTFTSTGVTHTISGTFTNDSTANFGTTTIASGGVINHTANTTAETYKSTINATNLTVSAGALIDVNSLGYSGGAADQAGQGTGAGALGGALSAGGGGGYGGTGGTGGGASGGTGGTTYGTQSAPFNIGSGGGGGDSAGGGAGGGAVKITTTGNLTVAGTIRANGAAGTAGTYGGAGGSGGSIWLTVGGNFNCSSGTVTANGGNGAGSTQVGGGGGGGRIARAVAGTYTACATYTVTAGTGGTGAGTGTTFIATDTPTSFGSGTITTSSIAWSVTDASTNETHFRLYNDSDDSLISSTATSTGGSTGTVYQLTDNSLSPNTTYSRYATAYDGTADSAPTQTLTVSTLANTPGTPTVNTPTTTSLKVTIAVNSNPAATEFALGIDNDNNGSIDTNGYVQANGTLGASAAWQTYSTWGGASGQVVTGLSVNVSYNFKAKARNADLTETAFSSGASAYTLAIAPTAPTVNATSSSSLTPIINLNGNPTTTQFVILETTSGNYVQANGSLSASPAWQTYTAWGSSSGTAVTGLNPNASYTFNVKARNGDNTETATSANTSQVTLANTPGTATVATISTTSLNVTIANNSNPGGTEFAIFESGTGKYIQANGTLDTSPIWQTYATWGSGSGQLVTGLSINTNYTFQAKSRNSNNAESPLSTSSAKYTFAVAPGTPTGSVASPTSVTLVVDASTNPANTEFSLYDTASNTYVQADGTMSGSAAWQTLANWGGITGETVTGLVPNTSFNFITTARNGDTVTTSSSTHIALVTHANIPTIASAEPVSSTEVRVILNANSNSASTEFAIYNSTTGSYLGANGELQASPAWQTYANWGGATGVINPGLSPSTTYAYQAKARNSLSIETAFSSTLSTTTAVTPSTPAPVTTPTATATTTSSPQPITSPTPVGTPVVITASPTATPTATPTVSPSPAPQCESPGFFKKLLNLVTGKKNDTCDNGTPSPSPTPTPICILLCDIKLNIALSPKGGTYSKTVAVEASYTPKSHDAKIYYTLNGESPTDLSVLYRQPIYVEETTTISAKAIGSESETLTETYVITPSVLPTPSPSPTTSTAPSATPTVNPTPTATATLSPTNVPTAEPSAEPTGVPTPTPTPTFITSADMSVSITPNSGDFSNELIVTINGSGLYENIYYTADGSDPRVHGLLYYGPITLSQSAVITAVAKDSSGAYSEFARNEYHFTNYTETVIIDWGDEPIVTPAPSTDSSPTATPSIIGTTQPTASPNSSADTDTTTPPTTEPGNIQYKITCNGEVISQTTSTQYSDTEERLDGCHYEVSGTTKDGETVPVDELTITRVASFKSANASDNPLAPFIPFLIFISLAALAYLGFVQIARRWQSFTWAFGLLFTVFAYQKPKDNMLTGRVISAVTNAPVSSVLVQLMGADNRVLARSRTNKDGQFTLPLLSQGAKITAIHPLYSFVNKGEENGHLIILATPLTGQASEPIWRTRSIHGALLVLGTSVSLLLFLNRVTWLLGLLVAAYTLYSLIQVLPLLLNRK